MNAEKQIPEVPVCTVAESSETDSTTAESTATDSTEEESSATDFPDEPEGWEEELDVYPLREPSEDPSWAIKTVKIWLYFCSFSFLFCLVLVILGIWYD